MSRTWILVNNRKKIFVYGLSPKIKAMVRMWKPSSVVEEVENARYVEEHMSLNKGMRSEFSQHIGFVGKALGLSPGEEALGHPLMEIESVPEKLQ